MKRNRFISFGKTRRARWELGHGCTLISSTHFKHWKVKQLQIIKTLRNSTLWKLISSPFFFLLLAAHWNNNKKIFCWNNLIGDVLRVKEELKTSAWCSKLFIFISVFILFNANCAIFMEILLRCSHLRHNWLLREFSSLMSKTILQWFRLGRG